MKASGISRQRNLCVPWIPEDIGSTLRALGVGPIGPRKYLRLTGVAGAHLFKRNFEEVLIWTERALERKQNAIVALRYRIIALAYLGKVEEATTTMQRMLVFQPNFGLGRLKMFTFRYPWMIGLIHDGLL